MPATATRTSAPTRTRASGRGRPRTAGPLATLWRRLEGPRMLDLSTVLIAGSTAVLTVLGLTMVLSSSSVEAIGTSAGSYGLFQRQGMWALVGIAVLVGLTFTPLRWLKALAWPALGLAGLLLALVAFTPLGVEVNGNRNWLDIAGFRAQPSEAAKLALALWSAAVLERKGRLITQVPHALLPVLPVGGLLIALVMVGSDLGTVIILASILGVVLFIAGTNRRVFWAFAAVVGVGGALMTLLAGHRLVRVRAWMGDCSDASDPCFQPSHGIDALASGGWLGQGLGGSRQKWSYIPEAENDFIFTILGEEMGLLGTLAVLVAFAALAVGMYRVASGTHSTFIRLTTWGILMWLVGQAFVNIAMVTRLLPVIGVPLPFISYGGSALTLALAGVGVVLSFARHERRRAAETGPDAPPSDIGEEDADTAPLPLVRGTGPVPTRPEESR
ncbi:putative peptidoglycan glycosyltransferase FtsW [Micrococcus sp.]|uniref:FtsW/RodA/SpoVE family cell cycle protein n=1 Tax=Micrococcus sp. TaxID=1271 RepID=UPI002A91F94D|nr:putative peptidoglycan glycosyltransferase FtsW [Micrococcus sp.]MDY6055563.1 putative peptidoglycan glycosyltransferase FtsW [Micrococcus sp.]